MFWVYLLKCADKSYYAGHTDNLENRLAQHHGKEIPDCHTATRLPVMLVYSQEFPTREEALASERQIKEIMPPNHLLSMLPSSFDSSL